MFEEQLLKNTLGEIVSEVGLKQMRIAETEKYAHVTFFFNGGIEQPFEREERSLIPSPKVATYDLMPKMSAYQVTDCVCQSLEQDFALTVVNFANCDMVGHSGNIDATIKAVECLDWCLDKIEQTCAKLDVDILFTADHGNAEKMYNSTTEQAHTAHTSNPVPLIYIGKRPFQLEKRGILGNIAPTVCKLLDIKIPTQMECRPLVK